MKTLLLAAGLGTRFRPHTEKITKPAIEFLNIPILYHLVGLLRASRKTVVDEFVINTHYKPEQIEALAAGLKFKTEFSHEKAAPLGSGGAIFFARKKLEGSGDFFLANGDEIIWPRHLDLVDKMVAQHKVSGALATILVKRDVRVGTQFGGVWADPSRRVHGFGKTRPTESPLSVILEGFHYTGVILLSQRIFEFAQYGESNIFYDILKGAIAKGENVEIFFDDSRWFETGNLRDYLTASREALAEMASASSDPYLQHLFALFPPGKLEVSGGTNRILRGDRVQVASDVQLEGMVILGDGVHIPAGCRLRNVVVRSGMNLSPGNYEENLIL